MCALHAAEESPRCKSFSAALKNALSQKINKTSSYFLNLNKELMALTSLISLPPSPLPHHPSNPPLPVNASPLPAPTSSLSTEQVIKIILHTSQDEPVTDQGILVLKKIPAWANTIYKKSIDLLGVWKTPLTEKDRKDKTKATLEKINKVQIVHKKDNKDQKSTESATEYTVSGSLTLQFLNQDCVVDSSPQNWTMALPPLDRSSFQFFFYHKAKNNYVECAKKVNDDFFSALEANDLCIEPLINTPLLDLTFGEEGAFSVYAQNGLLPAETASSYPSDKILQCQIDVLNSTLKREKTVSDIVKIACVVFTIVTILYSAVKKCRSQEQDEPLQHLENEEDPFIEVNVEENNTSS
jgi:hypothetical protein